MKKKILCGIFAAIMLLMAIPVFADQIDLQDPSIPSSAKVYGAQTCHYGFTTSRYLTKPSSGFGSTINVSSTYIKWDDYVEYDMYEFVKPRDQNGNYLKDDWGLVYCGYDGTVKYSILTMTPNSTSTKIYLRVENPSHVNSSIMNHMTELPIENMKCHGYFWL